MLLIVDYDWSDWLTLGLIESASFAVLVMILFQAPISDWRANRRLRKDMEWRQKQRALRRKTQRKFEMVGQSEWHGQKTNKMGTVIDGGMLAEDDPIYNGSWLMFSGRKPKQVEPEPASDALRVSPAEESLSDRRSSS